MVEYIISQTHITALRCYSRVNGPIVCMLMCVGVYTCIDCCDGSDEFDTSVVCTNTCGALAAEASVGIKAQLDTIEQVPSHAILSSPHLITSQQPNRLHTRPSTVSQTSCGTIPWFHASTYLINFRDWRCELNGLRRLRTLCSTSGRASAPASRSCNRPIK